NKSDNVEWLNRDPNGSKQICGLSLCHAEESNLSVHVQFDTDDDQGIAVPHLLTTVMFARGIYEIKLELLVYPGEAWIRQRFWVRNAGVIRNSLPSNGEEQSSSVHINNSGTTSTSTMLLDENTKI